MSLDDNEGGDVGSGLGVENPLGLGLDQDLKEEKVKNPHDQLTIASALGCIAGTTKYADVFFLVGTGKEMKRIPAHRIVLAAASDVFEAMLYPPIFPDDKPSQAAQQKELEIEIPDVRAPIFRAMLSAVYTDKPEFKAEEVPELILCARKFQLEGLRQLCVTFMQEGITVKNACTLFEQAEKMLNEKEFALPFIEENTADVVADPSWDNLPKERLRAILQSSKLCIDEIDLFKGLLRWGLAEAKRNHGGKDTIEVKKLILGDLLPHIRFPLMSMEDVATFVVSCGLLEPQQLLEIYTSLADKKAKCSFSTQPRSGGSDKWTLDPGFKSHSLQLSEKNMTVLNNAASHSYILGSQEFKKGVHAWRVTRKTGQNQWLLLGVSRKEQFPDGSYNSASFYGWSGASQMYRGGQNQQAVTNFANGPLDVMLDVDKGNLVVINLSTGQRVEMNGLPPKTAWVPHFGPHSNQQISVRPIKAKEFGKR